MYEQWTTWEEVGNPALSRKGDAVGASQGFSLHRKSPYLLTPVKFRREADLLSYGFQWFLCIM